MILSFNNYLFATGAFLTLSAVTSNPMETTETIEPAIILSWNTKVNVFTEPEPRVLGEVYKSIIYDDSDSDTSYGGILWVESDVQGPGLQVVTKLDGEPGEESCIMTAGFDPENPTEQKQCNDGFQTSKRFKRFSSDANGPVDLDFTFDTITSEGEGNSFLYRVFEKYENLTPYSIEGFTVQLGTRIEGVFEQADAASGISFVDQKGASLAEGTVDCLAQGKSLAALFAFGLFGYADTNENQDLDGYYDPAMRSCLKLKVVSPTEISTDGLSGELSSIYGEYWMSKSQSPVGFFYDIDNNPSTDNLLVGDWYDSKWFTRLSCESPVSKELRKKKRMKECVDYAVKLRPCPTL